MVGCGDDDNSGSEVVSSFLGATLNLSGQVWTRGYDYNFNERFNGSMAISFGYSEYDEDNYVYNWIDIGGSGSVTTGQLSFTIGTPSVLSSSNFDGYEEIYTNFKVSNTNIRGAIIREFKTSDGFIARGNGIMTHSLREFLNFIYVDRDVSITGTGKTMKLPGNAYTTIFQNINLNLKTGWNAVYYKDDYDEDTNTNTEAYIPGDQSHFRWIFENYYDDDEEW